MKKRIIIILLCALLIGGAIPQNIFAISQSKLGDINGDGKVNSLDYVKLRQGLLYNAVLPENKTDFNNDGKISSMDYIWLRLNILGTLNTEGNKTEYGYIPISYGADYTYENEKIGEKYPDNGSDLTDGIFAGTTSYSNSRYVGLNGGKPSVIIDLGDNGKDIHKFEVSYISTDSAGISPPKSIDIFVSNDKSEWTDLGNATIGTEVTGKVEKAPLSLSEPIDARYVKFTLSVSGAWLFVDELTVFTYGELQKTYTMSELINEAMKTDLTASERKAQIDKVKSEKAFESKPYLISRTQNAAYTLSSNEFPIEDLADDGIKLTDGNIAFQYSDSGWVSLNGQIENSVTVELDREYDDLCHFSINILNDKELEASTPSYVDYKVSYDGVTWYNIHRQYGVLSDDKSSYNFKYTPNLLIKAKYVRFTMGISPSSTVFVSEINVSSPADVAQSVGFYPTVNHDLTDYGSIPSPSKETQNLILGKEAQIATSSDYATVNPNENTKMPATVLTDGFTPTTVNYNDPAWFHCYGATGRYIYFDLKHISSVEKFEFSYLYYKAPAIYESEVTVLASENAKAWYTVGTHKPAENEIKNPATNTYSITLDKPVKARYICFYMTIRVHLFIGELSVYGTQSLNNAVSMESQGYDIYFKDPDKCEYQAPSKDVLNGATDLCLVYYNNDVRNEEYFLPHVGYIKNGKVTDTMFDSFLFLPNPSQLSTGGHFMGASYMNEWITLQDKLFLKDQNLEALNSAAGKVKETLGIPDYKYQFTVSIPYLSRSVTDFGDYDGDGVSESLESVEERINVVKWYVNRFYSLYDPEKYPHLEFAGWYWFNESIIIDETETDDVPVLQGVSEWLHSRNDQFFWIPWYHASGYKIWDELGFDSACMQVGYAFDNPVTIDRVQKAADTIKAYGMCIEIEIDGKALTSKHFFDKYLAYLGGGVKYGYMENSIHMYYEAGGLFGSAYKSGKYGQLIYDYTYQFIKHKLDDIKINANDATLTAMSSFPIKYALVSPTDAIPLTFTLKTAPLYGSVTLNSDGSLMYTPSKDYNGSDSFEVTLESFTGETKTVKINVNVGKNG